MGLNRETGARSLRLALIITAVFMVVEFIGGWWTNSLALMADSGHMLTDAAALGLSLFAVWFVRRPATPDKTYGYFRVEILAALINGVALVVIALAVLYESYQRVLRPQEVKSLEMLAIGGLGLVANLASAWVLHSSHLDSLNVRGALLHVIGDVLGSAAVIVAALAIRFGDAYWADPAVSALVSLLILASAWKLVRDSVAILLEGTPSHVNIPEMKRELAQVPGVEAVHDLHVWTLTSGVHVMTCHAVVGDEGRRNEVLSRLSELSRERFNIGHTTIQIEDAGSCAGDKHCG